MAVGFWRTGPAIVYSYTGTAAAQEMLGYAQGGVDIDISKNYKEIFSDVFGEMTPHELQDFGEVATITCPLISIDPAVLTKVLNRGNRGAAGQLNTPGRLVGTNGDDFAIGIAASDDTPWKFLHCVLRPNARIPMSVGNKPVNLTFFAWPFAPASTVSAVNTPLYTRAL
ncbi:hypothetical protein GobsT_31060 [Gemmata obscuriglobus]|uniref:Uncharacterized protein n=1 Tax=Gemmata obscuriglobus TaxID=114 RepID=A0A2Z3HAQ5_9BACT|nr:hypothetical protein [Gemmata obscuriglobus]AWM38704.1 hypothetical protein C1280_18055 [Gemmata obscuriglobus]QEG28329.1 hypothetical protein GobsT_31060 [Gemmata obscuriglobus]VTS06195.1 unnamed protein product [Gemmata obscuriglobus UQM 2246]